MRIAPVAFAITAACGTNYEAPTPDSAPAVTWYQDAGPIVAKHCMKCHQDGGIAPFSLTTYDAAANVAGQMIGQVQAKTMPPFNAEEAPECTPRFGWVDDPRLSAQEIQTLAAWVAGGAQAGTKVDIAVPTPTGLSGVTQTLAPTTPWVASGSRDQFICTILDPQTTGEFVNGLQVRPGNAKVVHHVVVTEILASNPATAPFVAAHGIGTPFDCSTFQQPGDLILDIWTPGNTPLETPTDLAVPIVAGAKIVMQIHYHPAGGVNDPDVTSIDLRASTTWPKRLYTMTAFGNAVAAPQLLPDPDDRVTGVPEFRIPANATDHWEHMQFVVPSLGTLTDVRFYSVNPHQHLIGTHARGTITRAAPTADQPATECLANGPWNFDWQRTYVYDAPLDALPSVAAGDVIDVTCHWNNSLTNTFEQRALADAGLVAPVDVTLGEGQSTDEMCLEIFGLSIPAPPPPTGRTAPIDRDLPDLRALARR
jgi:hypothetical protein